MTFVWKDPVKKTLLLGALVLVVSFFTPHTALAAFQTPAGKTPKSNGIHCWYTVITEGTAVQMSSTEANAREENGTCEIQYTDGTSLYVNFDSDANPPTQTERILNTSTRANVTTTGYPRTVPQTAATSQATTGNNVTTNANAPVASGSADVNNAAAAQAQVSETQTAAAAVAEAHSQCNIPGNIWPCVGDLVYEVVKRVALFFLWLAAFFLGLVGIIFNWTIYITVFQFGNLIGNNPGMLAAWGILRDIGNILLLFGFIFMGISTILNLPGNEFTAKRALPTLIIFAILMNFSLFAAEAIIDTSNALGSTLYRQAGNGLCTDASDLYRCATESGIAGAIMQITGITTIFNPADGITVFTDSNVQNALIMIGLTIFVATLAMVLLAATIMLSIRAVTLAFLMAVSPIGFAGMAVPILHKFAKMWWDQLLKQAFYAPVYILMVLVAVKFVDGMRVSLGSETTTLASAISSGGISNVSIVVMFILMVGFLLAATQTAKDMSAIGSSAATKMAGAVVFGGMARVSNTVTNGAARVARTSLQRSPVGNLGITRFVTNNMLRPIENANTDIRNWAVPGMGAISKVAGGPAEHATLGDMQHQIHDVHDKMQKNDAQYNKEVALIDLKKQVKDIEAGKIDPKTGKVIELSPENQRFLAGLSTDELAAMHDIQHGVGALINNLSPDQFQKLMESDKLNAVQKKDISGARFDGIKAAVAGEYSAGKDTVRGLNNKELEMLAKYDAVTFEQLLKKTDPKNGESIISSDQNEFLGKNSSLTKNQRDLVYTHSRKGQVEAAVGDYNRLLAAGDMAAAIEEDEKIKRFATTLNSKNKAKLSSTALLHPTVIASFTVADLTELQRESKFDDEDIRKVAAAVRDAKHPNSASINAWFAKSGVADTYWHK